MAQPVPAREGACPARSVVWRRAQEPHDQEPEGEMRAVKNNRSALLVCIAVALVTLGLDTDRASGDGPRPTMCRRSSSAPTQTPGIRRSNWSAPAARSSVRHRPCDGLGDARGLQRHVRGRRVRRAAHPGPAGPGQVRHGRCRSDHNGGARGLRGFLGSLLRWRARSVPLAGEVLGFAFPTGRHSARP